MQPEKESSSTSSSKFQSPEDSGSEIFFDVETDLVVPKVNSNSREQNSQNISRTVPVVSFNITMNEKTPLLQDGLSRSQDQNEQDVKIVTCNK